MTTDVNISEREKEVIDSNEDLLILLCQGEGFKQIADIKGISTRTVEKKAERIRQALGCNNLRKVVYKVTIYWMGKTTTG